MKEQKINIMLDTYNEWSSENPINRVEKETEKSFEDLLNELNKEDRDIIDSEVYLHERKYNDAQRRFEYLRDNVREFFSLLDSFTPKDLENTQKMLNLAENLKR